MTIKLYKVAEDERTVSKTLDNQTSFDASGTARDTFDVMGGFITIASDTDLTKYNYCYISELSRYYYINDISIIRNGVYLLRLRADVLMTYSPQIRALTGTVDRQENLNNGYIQDGEYQALAYTQIVTKTFPNGMTSDNLILMTVG